MKGKSIFIEIKKQQLLNDVSVECNLIGRTLGKAKEMEELAADIMSPSETATKPVVARAMSEGFGMVKSVCRSYLTMGRSRDDNRLEKVSERQDTTYALNTDLTGGVLSLQLQKGVTYEFRLDSIMPSCSVNVVTVTGSITVATVESVGGRFVYTPTECNQLKFVTEDAGNVNVRVLSGEYGSFELELLMPDAFNLGMTSVVTDNSHRLIVDYVMASLLKNQLPEKWQVYQAAVAEDAEALRKALLSRLDFKRRAADWD